VTATEPVSPPPTPALDSLRVAPALLVKLGPAQAVSGDGALAIGVDRSSFRVGDRLQFRFALARPMHVYVAYINSAGDSAQLYPNAVQKDVAAEPGRLHWVPPRTGSDFVLRVAEPVGRDRIVAVASAAAIGNFAEIAGKDGSVGDSRAELTVEVKR
jgi:hypothetical protein